MTSDTENAPKADNLIAKAKGIGGKSEGRNKVLLPTILFLIILPISIFILSQEKNKKTEKIDADQNANSPIVLYYSDKCSHCKALEKWIEDNNIQAKTSFARKEAGANRQNAEELIKRAGECNIPEEEIGVPFLWDGNTKKCLMGYDKITAYFQEKTSGETNTNSQSQDSRDNTGTTNKTK